MAEFTFDGERACPECGTKFTKAEQLTQYDPVVVVKCPSCSAVLWRPGSEESSPLFPYDPDADAGGL